MSDKGRILVADDDRSLVRIMERLLQKEGFEVLTAFDGPETLEKVSELPPDVILLDIAMPRMNGFEVARRLKDNEETKIIPIVMVTALTEVADRVNAFEAGADDFLIKPVDNTELRARVKSLLKVKAYNDHMRDYQKELEAEVIRRTEQMQQASEKMKDASLDTIYRLSRAAESKDDDTGAHVQRVSQYAAAVARKMRLNEELVEGILYAAPMHDVGKIGIPDRILLKPGS